MVASTKDDKSHQGNGYVAPKGVNMPLGPAPKPYKDIPLTENSEIVMGKRYVRKDKEGNPAETIHDTFWRVASNVAASEQEHNGDMKRWADVFYELLTDLRFLPNSPTFTGAGTPLGNLSACFVLPIGDDMGKESDGIFQTLRDAALIQQTGGGNGFSFSRLRSHGTRVKSSNGQASGPIGFLKAYDQAFGIVNQGGARRGANMGVLRVDHPDVREFITSKTDESQITNFNISVAITDAFMEAVANDTDYDLIEPSNGEVVETVRAREIFDLIAKYAHHNGEPGVLFIDAANRSNPIPNVGTYEATNPCVTGDTRIYTDRGMIRAVELFDDGSPTRVAIDGRFGVADATTPATHVFLTGVKPVFRLMTKEGYSLRATADHRIMTEDGWRELSDLQAGDRLHILNRKGGFGAEGTEELGRVLGWLVGDSTIKSDAAVLSFFGEEKRELAPVFAGYVDALVEPMTVGARGSYPVGAVDVAPRDEARVSSERLRVLVAEHGLTETKHQVPESVFRGTEAMQRGFLQALFTADGSFQNGGEKGASVRLAANALTLLEDVQRLLLNFGIASKIYKERRPAGYRQLPDSNRELKEYWCEAQHELVISKHNMAVFASEIGFLMDYKQSALEARLDADKRGPYREAFTATVESITADGEEAVYDLTEPLTHSFIADGVVVHNCGEQWLLGYESCNLGSVNLAVHVTEDHEVDWAALQTTIEESTRFLDDVITANRYVDAVPQLKQAAMGSRRIGLGFMGLADMMVKVGLRYGSPEGQEFAAQISEFMRYHSMKTSIQLAEERGPFLSIIGSVYDPANMKWEPPTPIQKYRHDWGRPEINWNEVVDGIKEHGIRNAAQTTIAPTGTISTVSGCEGYGCEPIFALAYTRYVVDGDKRIELDYASPLLEAKLKQADLDEEQRKAIISRVSSEGTAQNIEDIPTNIRNALVVSSDVSPEEHVRMQASIQAFIDNSISKTINMPSTATVEDVQTAYRLAWELGAKGLTVYVTGSRDTVVLETKATREKREGGESTESNEMQDAAANPSAGHVAAQTAQQEPLPILYNEKKKPRPSMLNGKTFRAPTPVGTAYITINENGYGQGQPFEVFITTSKAGSEIAAISEAMGRLISLTLRQTSPVSPRDRIAEITRQLIDIGGGRQMGFGPNRVASLPDAIAKTLAEYLRQSATDEDEAEGVPNSVYVQQSLKFESNAPESIEQPVHQAQQPAFGDICPSCGSATLIRREGCVSCNSCGYSEC